MTIHRGYQHADADTTTYCTAQVTGPVTLADLVEHFPPGTEVRLNLGTIMWQEPATRDEIDQRKAAALKAVEKRETWERAMYERLKAKFERP